MSKILFAAKSNDFSLDNETRTSLWLEQIAEEEDREIQLLEIIFMTDDELLEMNRSYLDHDYYTDIITFPYQYDPISAELYISIDRVKENALQEQVSFSQELHRVMVHGLLHLSGYDDHSDEDKNEIRVREDAALSSLEKLRK